MWEDSVVIYDNISMEIKNLHREFNKHTYLLHEPTLLYDVQYTQCISLYIIELKIKLKLIHLHSIYLSIYLSLYPHNALESHLKVFGLRACLSVIQSIKLNKLARILQHLAI